MTPAQAAAAVAATFPPDSPEADLARLRLDALVEAERNHVTKIRAPHPAVTGPSQFGTVDIHVDGVATREPFVLVFDNGVAEHRGPVPEGVRDYLLRAGFTVDGVAAEGLAVPAPADAAVEGTDEPILLGTPLRDAAVDPRADEVGPAGAAGDADPHGPRVWNATVGTAEYQRQVELARAGNRTVVTIPEGGHFSGRRHFPVDSIDLDFVDGVAVFDGSLPTAIRDYLAERSYGIRPADAGVIR